MAIWIGVGAFAGVHIYFQATLEGESASLLAALSEQTLAALAWVPTTLVVIGLTARFPLRADRWRLPVAVHAVAAVCMALATNVLMAALHGAVRPGLRAPGSVLAQGFGGFIRWVHIDIVVYALIASVAHIVRRVREDRVRELRMARLEAELTRANLAALKLQLQPHFFFNTLHTIGVLWRTGRPEAAQDVLERLSGLLRRVLDPGTAHEVTLEEELELIEEYLAIEAVRLGDRLRVDIDMQEEALDAFVPSFLLQPLVENAVRHGIEPSARSGTISIRGRRSGDDLRIEVTDDGVGMGGGQRAADDSEVTGAAERSGAERSRSVKRRDGVEPAAARDSGRGIGIANTRRRLRALHGRARLDLESPPSGGTRVSLTLPYRDQRGSGIEAADG